MHNKKLHIANFIIWGWATKERKRASHFHTTRTQIHRGLISPYLAVNSVSDQRRSPLDSKFFCSQTIVVSFNIILRDRTPSAVSFGWWHLLPQFWFEKWRFQINQIMWVSTNSKTIIGLYFILGSLDSTIRWMEFLKIFYSAHIEIRAFSKAIGEPIPFRGNPEVLFCKALDPISNFYGKSSKDLKKFWIDFPKRGVLWFPRKNLSNTKIYLIWTYK